jgi:hypothetical protein
MKKFILSSFIFIMTTILYGHLNSIDRTVQDSLKCKPEIKISVAPTENCALYYQFVAGGPGRKFKPGFSTSFEYLFCSDKKINLGFGLCYQFAQIEYTPNMNTPEFFGQTDKVSVISLNLSTVYKFEREFYLSFNPMINLQINYNSDLITDKQTGMGLSFSIGKYFNLNDKLRLNIEPKIWINNIIPFQYENCRLRLTICGLNLGIAIGQNNRQQLDI